MNPHAIIVGHTGSGKSVLIKATEIFQTLISTSDDILILDPQNEFKEIVEKYGGSYFDLTPKSKIYINGFEVSDAVFYADKDTKEKFIATQTKYAKSLVAAIMTNILFTQEHATVVSRATRKMFDKIFAQKRLKKQATLRMLREEIKLELENAKDDYDRSIIKPIYNSLEEYTEGSCDMLAYPSTVRLDNRMIGFGLKNVPPDNWEPVMVTVMHYTSTRMEYNQEAQRATHFIVDETQVVSRKGTSAEQLNTAVATFRKYGGICTMAMQNITAALENKMLKELFSNCNYKCFLDQGGADANALAQIQELSQTEFNALNSEEVGKGVMVWGKKVVLFDALETGVVKRYITDFGTEDLLNKPKVTVFPHVGGSTSEAELNCAIMAGQTIRRFMETGEIVNSVNFPRVQQALSAPYRITLINKNVPNIVARISTAVSDFNINIDNIINRSKGDYAYTLLDLDETDKSKIDELVAKFEASDNIVRVRLIKGK